jgi:hypothetical protein
MNDPKPTFFESLSEYAGRCRKRATDVKAQWHEGLTATAVDWAKRPYRWKDGQWRETPEEQT